MEFADETKMFAKFLESVSFTFQCLVAEADLASWPRAKGYT